MMTVWRIVPRERAASAFDGEGARRFGGRWNSPGLRVVYTAGSRALACLETFVHLPDPPPKKQYVIIQVLLEDAMVMPFSYEKIDNLATLEIQRKVTRGIGDAFIREKKACVLEVPSVIVPGDLNYLINPQHPDFQRVRFAGAEPFAFDSRLLSARKVV